MSSAAMQRASQQQAMQQRAAAQRSGLRAMPQRPAAMPKQAAGQMADFAFNAVQNRNMQQFNQAPAAARAPAQQAQQSPNLVAAVNAAQQKAMQQFNQVPVTQQLAKQQATTQERRTVPQQAALVPQTQPKPTPDMSAIATPAVLSPEQRKAVMRGEKVTAPPAMRKGGAVKKKPGYAKGGMVMANCGASMKPQQKAKK